MTSRERRQPSARASPGRSCATPRRRAWAAAGDPAWAGVRGRLACDPAGQPRGSGAGLADREVFDLPQGVCFESEGRHHHVQHPVMPVAHATPGARILHGGGAAGPVQPPSLARKGRRNGREVAGECRNRIPAPGSRESGAAREGRLNPRRRLNAAKSLGNSRSRLPTSNHAWGDEGAVGSPWRSGGV